MISQIDKPIRVGAVFEPPDRIRPAWFIWQGRRHLIRDVTYTWTHREGNSWVRNFSVYDGANLYQISYNTGSMVWILVALEEGG